jgi:proton-dependent oligopeptide transporter, POT family
MSFTAESFKKFPKVFWSANFTVLFERAAYYSMASLLVLYLKKIGLGSYWPSTLNGMLWGLVYFLPILSGSLADHFGFRKSLLLAFILLFVGYGLIGLPIWSNLAFMDPGITSKSSSLAVTASPVVVGMIILAFMFIGCGGSIIKPVISGTIQKSSPIKLVTLGFGIFYMVINIGSVMGRGVSYIIRTNTNLSFIFAVAAGMSVLAFFSVLLMYEEKPIHEQDDSQVKEEKSLKKSLMNMIYVLKQVRFVLFLVIVVGFAFLYHQVYNIIPLYLEKFVENDPPVDIYTLANPITVVLFQLIITRIFGRIDPIKAIIIGIIVISLSMLVNIIPLAFNMDLRSAVVRTLPLGGLFAIITVTMIAFGELFQASRQLEFIGKLAPKGQEGLFMGFANLPMAIGAIVGGPVGAYIFNDIMVKQDRRILGWSILGGIGLLSALATYIYSKWLDKHPL